MPKREMVFDVFHLQNKKFQFLSKTIHFCILVNDDIWNQLDIWNVMSTIKLDFSTFHSFFRTSKKIVHRCFLKFQ